MKTNGPWAERKAKDADEPAKRHVKPLRPQVLAAMVAIVVVLLLDGMMDLTQHAVTAAVTGLIVLAGRLIEKDPAD